MNYNDIAYTAVSTALINYKEQLDAQLEEAYKHHSMGAMLQPLGKGHFMFYEPYRSFTLERDNTKVDFLGMCNAYSGMFDKGGHREEVRFAEKLAHQFKDYVIAWFEQKESEIKLSDHYHEQGIIGAEEEKLRIAALKEEPVCDSTISLASTTTL